MTDRRIAQRFSVHATLDEGKLGTLFWTHDDERGAPALLLLLSAATQSDDETLRAIVADQLSGPHVLNTYAYGRTDEGAWLATDAAAATPEASTLEAVLKRRDRLDLPQILRLAVALSRAVDALTAAGKQHLDIQPHRVWLATGALAAGAPQLFGIGWWRLLPAYQTGAQAETFYGNPEYLAAELCKGQPASATADVYGAATTLWAIAAGKPPFPSNQPLMALKRQAVEKPLRLDLVKPALVGVKDIQALVAEALDKEPTKRPAPASWRTAVENLAGQKAPEVLHQSAPAATTAPAAAPAPVATPVAPPAAAALAEAADSRETLQFAGSDVAAALAVAVASAQPAATQDEAAALASLPDGPAADDSDDDDDDGAETSGPRQGRRRRERRERQTVAGIGIAAALAEANLADQKPGSAGLSGLTPSSTPTLTGMSRPISSSSLNPLSPALPPREEPAAGRQEKAPARPESQGSPKVVVKQPSAPASAETAGRSLSAQIAEGAFFDDEPIAPSSAAELGDLIPPTPPKEKLNRKALLAIGGFAVLMASVSLWMSQRASSPEAPAPAAAPAAAEPEAVEPAADATTVAEAPAADATAVVAEPVVVPAVPTPEAAPPAAVPAEPAAPAAQPDAGATAADAAAAAAPALAPADAARQAEVQRLVDEGHSALVTKDPVTALARAQEALKLNAGHAPAVLLRQQAQTAVDAAVAEVKAAEVKAVQAKAEAAAAEKAKAKPAPEPAVAAKREAAKSAAKRAASAKAERAAAAKEAAAAKARAAKERAAAKNAQKAAAKAAQKKAEKEVAARPVVARPEARPVEKPAEDGGSASQEASKFAALAQKASKAKLKVLYLQKAVKLDPGNAGYKAQLKSAEDQLKTEGP